MERKFRTVYDVLKVEFKSELESMTNQSSKDSCDVNLILKRYGKTGMAPVMKNQALFGDFANVGDFHHAQEIILKAQEQFDALDAKVRERFLNRPQKMLEFLGNPENLEESYKLGLRVRPVVPLDDKKVSE